ncbi:MAG TPA: alkaline phosphatase D family protein [Nocardioidaceae bacterium]|nr:alkaline phosphatase D family protein [Nocardioidaceae bacterium]
MTHDLLVLGPLLRYVDQTSASIWVETRDAATVVVRSGDRSWSARTFRIHGHHYALVEVDRLEPGHKYPYEVEVAGTTVWPDPSSGYPPSVIATMEPGKPLRMAFGSCRTSVPHDAKGNLTHGVDALRAYALRMIEGEQGGEPVDWPDFVLFLGDQVYADETSSQMEDFIKSRRDIKEPPWDELKDYEEYSHLYWLAWSDPANRWLLSTLPSLMIFDDHDIRDDWNTSIQWKQQMEATSWWHERIVAGLGSYWVYQHLGNLSPEERAKDELWQVVTAGSSEADEVDISDEVDAFAARVDQEPTTYRWSYSRDIDDVRLVVVDSRAARVLEPESRSMLDPDELAWLDEQMQGGVRHLLIGTSLPFLLSPGLHHLEAWNEALVHGAWGDRGSGFGEWVRQTVDLEHWGAFQHGFAEVAEMAISVAYGERGTAPETVTFLSGDVHHSYVSEVRRVHGHPSVRSPGGQRSRIVQAVCSPIRNPLPRAMRFATAFLSYGLAGPMGAVAAKSAKVPNPPFTWGLLRGPWFDNNLAVLEDKGSEGLELAWYTGVVDGTDHESPRLEQVASMAVEPGRPHHRNRLSGPVLGRALSRASRYVERRRRLRGGRSPRPR